MTPRPLDTAPTSWTTYTAVLDRMGGAARLHAAVELSEAVREIRLAGIRARHPELTPRQAVAQLILEDYGVRLPTSP
jgi:hypothetical protein